MSDPIDLLIQGRAHDLGDGFAVRRVLPSVKRRMVGPFVFLDHFGPMDVPPGGGMEVRPHPHIGLATVSYLFEGGIFHRDSLGYAQAIRPGDVNWMTAGSGIAHSERTEPEMRRTGFRMHGVQTWVALPKAHEETAPAFEHVEAAKLPTWQEGGTALRLIVGSYAGRTAPTTHFSPIFYVGAELTAGAALSVSPEHGERAVYVADGTCCSHSHGAPISRVTTSRNTEPVNPTIDTQHRIISPASSGSSAFHLRWRWCWRTSERLLTRTLQLQVQR